MSIMHEKTTIKALLVCYDALLLRSEKKCIEIQGDLCIETALSNKEAFDKLEKESFDVIIAYIDSFSTSGCLLLKSLRQKGNRVPCIAFSLDDEKRLTAEMRASGATNFVNRNGEPSVVFPALKSCIISIVKSK